MRADFRFCPVCGGALESRSLKNGDPARLVCTACGFVFYLDPKLAVGTIITDADTGQTLLAGMGQLHLDIAVERMATEHGIEVTTGRPLVARLGASRWTPDRRRPVWSPRSAPIRAG